MEKVIYNVSGFDCASCATKAETHIAKQIDVEYAHMDFASNKLYITFKNKPWSIDKLASVIKEVESDPLNISIYNPKNKKVTYNVCGFDCASCAAKAEAHIAKHEDVEYAHMDYSSNKLYVTFKDESWDIDTLANVIKEVESDPLDISYVNEKKQKQEKLFNKAMWWKLTRIIIAVSVTLICIFLLGKQELNWLRFGLYEGMILLIGYDIFYKVILHIIHRNNILDHNLLILVAAIGSLTLAIIGLTNNENYLLRINDNYSLAFDDAMEALLVIVLFQIGSIVESVASNKSKNAIVKAVDLRIEEANLIVDEGIIKVKPEALKVDDIVLITAGETIPVDGEIIEGNGHIDTSSLTGEFTPVQSEIGNEVFSGCILKEGTIKIRVKRIYEESASKKIIDLITNSGEKKSRVDAFIDKFAKWYTPVIVLLAVLIFVIGGIISHSWMSFLHVGLEILVIGCPCAVVISVPLAYFSGLGLASKHGVVIKGSNYLDELYSLRKVVTDKTGTLTKGSFVVTKVVGSDKEELLNSLYAVECLSNHPIAKAICLNKDIHSLSKDINGYEEVAGKGAICVYLGHKIIAGNNKLLKEHNIEIEEAKESGTIVYCAKDNKYLGYVVLDDEIKEEAKDFVDGLHKEGIEVVMLTGDHATHGKEVAKELGIDRVFTDLLPDDKRNILENEMASTNGAVAFVGDGINDAPSIKRSDVGVAMGGIGSDVAVENADVVIMNDNPNRLLTGIKVAKKARCTSIFNIAFALTVKAIVLILVIIFPNWSYMMYIAIFSDTGLTVLLTINSLLLLHRKVK